jgi:hypothetical protein
MAPAGDHLRRVTKKFKPSVAKPMAGLVDDAPVRPLGGRT